MCIYFAKDVAFKRFLNYYYDQRIEFPIEIEQVDLNKDGRSVLRDIVIENPPDFGGGAFLLVRSLELEDGRLTLDIEELVYRYKEGRKTDSNLSRFIINHYKNSPELNKKFKHFEIVEDYIQNLDAFSNLREQGLTVRIFIKRLSVDKLVNDRWQGNSKDIYYEDTFTNIKQASTLLRKLSKDFETSNYTKKLSEDLRPYSRGSGKPHNDGG